MWSTIVEFIAYLAAPAMAIIMDRLYFESEKGILFGFFPIKTRYSYKDFFGYRIIGTVSSSFLCAYGGVEKEIVPGMVGAAIFLISHFMIYVDIYRRESR